MSEKKDTDYRKVTVPTAPAIFSDPNALGDVLDNLSAYDYWSNTNEVKQNPSGGTPLVEKHVPFADADPAKKIKKKAISSINPVSDRPFNSVVVPKKKPLVPAVDKALGSKIDVKAIDLAPSVLEHPLKHAPPAKHEFELPSLEDAAHGTPMKIKVAEFGQRVKKVHNLDEQELGDLLKDSDAYAEYLGLGAVPFKKDRYDSDFPMDDRTAMLLRTATEMAQTEPKPSAAPALAAEPTAEDHFNNLQNLLNQKNPGRAVNKNIAEVENLIKQHRENKGLPPAQAGRNCNTSMQIQGRLASRADTQLLKLKAELKKNYVK